MFLLIEILLVIFAWILGFGPWALIPPFASVTLFTFLLSSSKSTLDLILKGVVIDTITCMTLVFMIGYKGLKYKKELEKVKRESNTKQEVEDDGFDF